MLLLVGRNVINNVNHFKRRDGNPNRPVWEKTQKETERKRALGTSVSIEGGL